jgi:hypothetical protein
MGGLLAAFLFVYVVESRPTTETSLPDWQTAPPVGSVCRRSGGIDLHHLRAKSGIEAHMRAFDS